MEKIYRYQKHLRQPDSSVISVCAFFILLAWMIPVAARLLFFFPIGPFIRITFFLSVMILLLGIMGLAFFREMRETAFILTDTKLIKSSPSATITIPIESIDRLRYKSFGLFGYGLARAGREKLRMPFYIDNLNDFSKNLRTQLLSHNRSDSFKASEFDRFIRHARVSDLSALRIQKALKPLTSMMLGMGVFGQIIAANLWELPPLMTFAWIIISMSFPLGIFVVSDWWISQLTNLRLRRDARTERLPDTGVIYMRIGLAGGILYLLAGIVFKTVFWKILIYGM